LGGHPGLRRELGEAGALWKEVAEHAVVVGADVAESGGADALSDAVDERGADLAKQFADLSGYGNVHEFRSSLL